MVGLAILLPGLVRSQEYSCDSLELIYSRNPDADGLGWSFESLSEPSEGIEKFLKKKKSLEKINSHDWDVYCKVNKDTINVRISFLVLPSGKSTCFVPVDTICMKLNNLAIQFLSETKFKPARKNGVATLHKNSYPFIFKKAK